MTHVARLYKSLRSSEQTVATASGVSLLWNGRAMVRAASASQTGADGAGYVFIGHNALSITGVDENTIDVHLIPTAFATYAAAQIFRNCLRIQAGPGAAHITMAPTASGCCA